MPIPIKNAEILDTLKIGFFSIGLETYWAQFPGLEERLGSYASKLAGKIAEMGVDVVDLGMIDNAEKAFEAGPAFRRADVDLIFLYVSTYALSSTVLPAVRRAHVPVVVMNLAPATAIDYAEFNNMQDRTAMTGEWLAFCQSCPMPEIAHVFQRARIPFHQITGTLDNDQTAMDEIRDWVAAAKVAHRMERNRLGLMGHYYSGMLDVYSDLTSLCVCFGGHIEILEVEELVSLCAAVSATDIQERKHYFQEVFDIDPLCQPEELVLAARTSIALDRLIEKHNLSSMAYYYMGTGNPQTEDVMRSIILGNSLLMARGIPVAGEYEVKNAFAMKILDGFGAGGSFTEYYAVDYQQEVVLMGHDGPGHCAIAEGRTRVRPLGVYHGKVGHGLSVEMSVLHGPVTLLSVIQTVDGRVQLLVAEGESVPGPILQIGNTNSRYKFPMDVRNFMKDWNSHGPAHHCAVGTGHLAQRLRKLAAILQIECIVVCEC